MAQTISQPNSRTQDWSVCAGQSFQATMDGFITQIDIRTTADFTGNLLIYNSADGSGTIGDRGTPDYEQPAVSLGIAGPSGWVSIVLSSPYPVVNGHDYTFMFEPTSGT